MKTRDALLEEARVTGVVLRRDHPRAAATLTRMVSSGHLYPLLRGAYCLRGAETNLQLRVSALVRCHPDAVVTGDAAAALSFWPGRAVPVVTASLPHRIVSPPGYRFDQRRLPDQLICERNGVQMTMPALTALDLCSFDETEPLDRALRVGAASLANLQAALQLTRSRRGNNVRRVLLADSRDTPWSFAERIAHRLLRRAGITGWQANVQVRDAYGRTRYLDIGFRANRLALEIDGSAHGYDPVVFESDRRRQNALVLSGWMVLRFTMRQLTDEAELVVAEIREALALTNRAEPSRRRTPLASTG